MWQYSLDLRATLLMKRCPSRGQASMEKDSIFLHVGIFENEQGEYSILHATDDSMHTPCHKRLPWAPNLGARIRTLDLLTVMGSLIAIMISSLKKILWDFSLINCSSGPLIYEDSDALIYSFNALELEVQGKLWMLGIQQWLPLWNISLAHNEGLDQ